MAAIRAGLLFLVLLPVLLAAAQDAPESRDAADTIRDLRLQSNEAFAAHDIAAIVSFFDEDYQITTSVGAMSQGIDEQIDGLETLFESRPVVTYVRTPESITISRSNPLATESGTWEGIWTTANGPVKTGGSYSAMWRRVDGQWRTRAELFVALYCDGVDCP